MACNAFRSCFFIALLFVVPGSAAYAQGKTVTPTVSSWHATSMTRTAFSPDGRWLVSASSDAIKIWAVENGRMIRSFAGPGSEVTELQISSDGRSIAALTSRSLVVWNSDTGTQRSSIKLPYNTRGLELTAPDEARVVDTGQIQVYDTRTGQLKRKVGNEVSVSSESGYPNYAAFSPDRRTLALGYVRYPNKWLARVVARDAATGDEIAVFESHTDDVRDVAVSPDGNLIASGSADKTVRLFDLKARKLLHTWPGHENHLVRVIFSRDGKRVFSGDGSDYLHVWDVATGKQLDRIKLDHLSTSELNVSPDGKLLVIAYTGRITLWDAQTLKFVREMQGGSNQNYELKLHTVGPDTWLSSDDFYVHRRWSVTTGQLLQNLTTKIDVRPARKQSSDGSWPVVQLTGEEVSTSSNITDPATKTFIADTLYTFHDSVSDDTRLIAGARRGNQEFEIWDTQAGKRVSIFKQKDDLFYPVFSPDNRKIAGVSKLSEKTGAMGLRVWDVTTGKLEKTLHTGNFLPYHLNYSPDGKSILLHGKATTLVDAASGKRIWHISQDDKYYSKAFFSPDGKTIAVTEYGPRVYLLDSANGRVVRTFEGNPGSAESVLFLQNGTRVVSGNSNGTSAIWDARTGQLLATMVIQRSGEWITITPEGFFVSSEKGAELVHVARGFDTIGVQQVYQALYRPDLVKEKLAGDPKGIVRDAAQRLDLTRVVDSGPSPDIRVGQLPSASGQAQISLPAGIVDRGGGIGRIEWRVNGITSAIDETPASNSNQTLNLSRNLALDPGANVIEIVAYNRSNLVSSAPLRVTVQGPSLALPDPSRTRLFVLAAGLDNYADKKFQLTYSVRDADAVARALSAAGKGLYQNVVVKLLKNEDVVADKLDAAFKELAKQVTASDVFVIYLAGHGKTVDGRYHFIPQTFKVSGELTLQAVDAAVKAQGISQEQWQRWFAMISARRSVAIFDTCESGTLTGDDLSTKVLEQGAASERLAQATGRSILTASTGNQEALEGYREHGLFTYHLLEALDRGDSDNNGKLEINELAAYIYSQVTTVSDRVFRRKQEPQIKLATNYSLANRFRFLDENPAVYANENESSDLKQTAQVQVRPGSGATVVRSIAANSKITVVKSEGGWSLISQNGSPIGYVPTSDINRRR